MQNKTILNYKLLKHLGSGGMAEVWYAENNIGKQAAVKVLKEELTKMETVQERFRNEAQVMVTLKHPNIRQVYDYGTIDGRSCIVMEYLEGADLSTRLKRGERFSDAQLTQWWNIMVDTLQYTHRQGVVHRDIKPSNIFITDTGEPQLLDFGIAKIKSSITLTQTGNRLGTLMYMSPEQVRDSKNLDYRSDIYSLAVTFCHLVSGKAPYDSQTDSEFDIQMKIVTEDLDINILPSRWQTLLAPLLVKDPLQRGALVKLSESYGKNVENTVIEISPIPEPERGFKAEPEREQTIPQNRKEKKLTIWAGVIAGVLTAVLITVLSIVGIHNYNIIRLISTLSSMVIILVMSVVFFTGFLERREKRNSVSWAGILAIVLSVGLIVGLINGREGFYKGLFYISGLYVSAILNYLAMIIVSLIIFFKGFKKRREEKNNAIWAGVIAILLILVLIVGLTVCWFMWYVGYVALINYIVMIVTMLAIFIRGIIAHRL